MEKGDMFINVIPYQGKYIVYRPLKKLAFLANAALVNLIVHIQKNHQQYSPGKKNEAAALQFLKSIGFWEPEFAPPSPLPATSFAPTIATLFLTTACNLNCIYCYASGGENHVRNLPFALGSQAIDCVCQNAVSAGQGFFELSFHGGGEPTLAGENFRKLTEYAKAKELPCKITVTSNGYWDIEEREWILNHLDSVSLSFDGIPHVQNQQRPTRSGQGSFEKVWETILAMDRRKFPYGIRITVTDNSIEFLEDSITWLCRETSCRTFQVEPAFAHGRAQHNGTALSDIERFAAAFLNACDIAQSFGRHLYYSGARPWVITNRFCQAPERALVVTPDGSLSACYEIYDAEHTLSSDFILGKITPGGRVEFDSEARQEFFHKIEERRMRCEDCFCYWHCAGDCPAKTFSSHKNGHLHFGKRCNLNRLITKELLIRYIANGNGIWQGMERLRTATY